MKRSRFEVINDILLLSRGKKSITNIVYGANFSYSMCQKYFRLLIEKNLISLNEVNGHNYYETTKKGIRFLECYKEIQNFLDNKNESSSII